MYKEEIIKVEYGAKGGFLDGKYKMWIEGHTFGLYQTFKNKTLAEKRALENAKLLRKDFFQDINKTFYKFYFVKVEVN